MKVPADYVDPKSLKLSIHSSRSPLTCARYEGPHTNADLLIKYGPSPVEVVAAKWYATRRPTSDGDVSSGQFEKIFDWAKL